MKRVTMILGCLCVSSVFSFSLADIQSGLYWTNQSGTINRSDADGNNIRRLYTDPPGDISLIDLAVDQASQSIYFTGFGYNVPSKIQRLDVNTGTTELLYRTSEVPNESPAIRSIAINPNQGKMYWTEEFPLINQGRVACANLDGSGVEYILTTSSDNRMMPYGIDIDTFSNKLYWTDHYNGVFRCDTDGSDLERLTGSASLYTGIVLDVDLDKMYWVERFGNIMCSNLDGSDVVSLLDHQADVIDLTLDHYNNKLYWGDYFNGIIYKSNLDGSHIEQVVIGQSHPIGFAFVDVPEPTTLMLFGLGGLVLRKYKRVR